MRIHSWGQSAGLSNAQAVSGSSPRRPRRSDPPPASDGSLQVAVSKPAELFQKLTTLQQSDPASFKKVTGKIAEQFEQFASMATGPESQGLAALAQRFASAAQKGDLSAFGSMVGAHRPSSADQAPPAAPPPPPPPIDAAATAFSIVDALTSSSDDTSDPLQKLTALKTSDPAAFKKALGGTAEQLEQLASLAQGTDRDNLQQLAATFASSAQSGDLSAIQALQPPSSTPAPTPAAPPPPPPPPPPIDAVATAFSVVDALTPANDSTSDPLQKLTALKASDPAAFKKVVGRAAEQLEQLASLADGTDKDNLQQLATTFASSAQSGDLSALQALKPPSSTPAPTPPAPPPPPPPAPPIDAVATAFSVVDALNPSSDATSDPLQKLSALKTSDPAAFKKVMGQAAQQLEQLADVSDGTDRDNLQALAGNLASGAENGDLSALTPKPASPDQVSDPSDPAPPAADPAPPAADPAPAAPEGWRYRHVRDAYMRNGPPPAPPKALDDAFTSALALFDSMTSPAGGASS